MIPYDNHLSDLALDAARKNRANLLSGYADPLRSAFAAGDRGGANVTGDGEFTDGLIQPWVAASATVGGRFDYTTLRAERFGAGYHSKVTSDGDIDLLDMEVSGSG